MPDTYKIFETGQYLRDLRKLQISESTNKYKKIVTVVYARLRDNPYLGKNIKKLKSWRPETWRYRIGDLRLFYVIDDGIRIISIIAIEPRDSA